MRVSLVSAAFVLAVQAALPSPTFAANYLDCSEGGFPTNRHQGQERHTANNNKHGIRATIENDFLNQCSDPDLVEYSGNFIFVNVVPHGQGAYNIIQIGVGNCRGAGSGCATGMQYYYAWGRDDSAPGCSAYDDVWPTVSRIGGWTSGEHTLAIRHDNNWYEYRIDGVVQYKTTEANICWTPDRAVWFGESWDWGDAIGGTAGDPFAFTDMAYQNTENGPFYDTSFSPTAYCNWIDNNGNPYDCGISGAQTVNIWTTSR
jgi:hypothetical protein